MTNFCRVLRLALHYRMTVAASVVCSLAIALLWAAALMPVVDGVMHGKSIPDLVTERIARSTTKIAELESALADLKQRPAEDETDAAQFEARLREEKVWLARLQSVQPTAERWLPATPFGTLVMICMAVLSATILKNMFRIANNYFVSKLGHLTSLELRKEFYRRTLRLDLGTFRTSSNGDLMNRFTANLESITMGTQALFGMAVREPLKMVACLIGASLISWQLLLITILCAPPSGYAIHRLGKSLKRANRRALRELSSLYDHLEETFGGIKVIKAFTMESQERSRFHRLSKQYYRRSMKIAFYDSLASPVTEVMGISLIIMVVVAGGYLVLNQQNHLLGIRVSQEPLSHGMLTAFYALLAGVIDPVRRFSTVYNYLQRASAASDYVFEMFDRTTKVVNPENPVQLPTNLGQISFEHVSFSYRPEELVLDDVSLQVERGEVIAIVGPNGCGKSTLMNLVPRFYDPQLGQVTIDGIDLRDVRLSDLRKHIGLVTQETLLFDDTVINNIRYGSPEATEQQVIEAAKQAHADQFVTTTLSEGYQTVCGPSGNRLSGGQRQRLALARAILRNPEILILDEATSQIDVESERLIHEVLEQFVRGRTTFMITHRPNTLVLADRIVVMNAGRIVDVGSLEELTQRCELFCRLAHLDMRVSA